MSFWVSELARKFGKNGVLWEGMEAPMPFSYAALCIPSTENF